jgi:hypothetical protein
MLRLHLCSFVCGQQLLQVSKFRNTRYKIFEKFLPVVFQASKQCEILVPLHLRETYYESSISIQRRSQGEGGGGRAAGLQPAPQTAKTEIKKNIF